MKTGSRQVDHVLNEVPHGGKPKIEPIPYAVNLDQVEDLGDQCFGEKQPTGPFDRSIYDGPGYKNTPGASVNPPCRPGGGRTVLRSGSQGKR
jgi:hypothetical protein